MNNMRTTSLAERDSLEAQGCTAEDWNRVIVSEGFSTSHIRNCRFQGEVILEEDVYISNVGAHIANYHICRGAHIENVGVVETTGCSRFGQATKVETINENGGRTVRIFDLLTAQIAYVEALYRHRPKTIEAINAIAERYAESRASTMGTIGRSARLTNSNIIRNCRIGDNAVVDGAAILSNGTILSREDSPTEIGVDVKLYDFIVGYGSHIENDSLLKSCFVGQSVKIDNLTASNSLFFANSHFENCEACSIFAGPFTVSHHKSSLLIAGMFSFFNAGSGTNQSNHLFKTGAVHQGIHQRGCKFASNGYVMLPCKNGAFTVVIGRHRSHADTENFPYSYLVEEEESSYLIPGQNLASYGTVRDIDKWAKRDLRRGDKQDNINFEECNPFVGERIRTAITTLAELLDDDEPEVYNYGRMKIKATAALRGEKFYTAAIWKFIGEMLSHGTEADPCGKGHWIDCAGQYMPYAAMTAILERLESGLTNDADSLRREFDAIFARYDNLARGWAESVLAEELGHLPDSNETAAAIARGERAAESFKSLTDHDRERDFDSLTEVGYGIDATDSSEISADFDAVRR